MRVVTPGERPAWAGRVWRGAAVRRAAAGRRLFAPPTSEPPPLLGACFPVLLGPGCPNGQLSALVRSLPLETFFTRGGLPAARTLDRAVRQLGRDFPVYPSLDVETRTAAAMLLAWARRITRDQGVGAARAGAAERTRPRSARAHTLHVLAYQLGSATWRRGSAGRRPAALTRATEVSTGGRMASPLMQVRLAWLARRTSRRPQTAEAALALGRTAASTSPHRLPAGGDGRARRRRSRERAAAGSASCGASCRG